MKSFKSNILIICTLLSSAIIFNSCSKKEEAYRPGFDKGTTFPKLNLFGFTLEPMQVHIGPKSSVAGIVFEDISGVSFEVPFADTQRLNRIVFYTENGKEVYKGSQIRFDTPTKDTTLKVFYDGITFQTNPVFPMPASGKMGLRVNFKSAASAYKGRVNIEFHEEYTKEIKVPARDPLTGAILFNSRGDTLKVDSTIFKIRPEVALLVPNVIFTEFSEFVELPAPVEPTSSYSYIFYVRVADTGKPLPYPAGENIAQFGKIDFMSDYTALYTIDDILVDNAGEPKRIDYLINDRMGNFLQ